MSLHVEKLNVRYGKSHVVFDLDVKVAPGEVLALLGRNGAGKTTTIKAIVGLLPGTSGNVTVADRNVSHWPAWRRCRAGMAYVPSGARCFPNLTVEENLDIPRRRGRTRPFCSSCHVRHGAGVCRDSPRPSGWGSSERPKAHTPSPRGTAATPASESRSGRDRKSVV